MGATTIYLIRHCEAEGNVHRRIHGVFDSDITPRGARQLESLCARFRDIRLSAVYASPLLRARKTAQALAEQQKTTVTLVPDLHERSMGEWEDFSWHEIKEKYPTEFAAWRADVSGYRIPGGESEDDACERFSGALRSIAAKNSGKTVAAVAHSMVIKILQFCATGLEYDEVGWGDNTSVSKLVVEEDGSFRFLYRNDASHLPKILATMEKQKWSENGESLNSYSLLYTAPGPEWSAGESPLAREMRACGLALPEGELILGTEGGREAGVLCLRGSEVAFLYVAQSMRGYGYGVQLLGEALYRLRLRGAKELLLHPGPDGAWAAFLEKNAFSPVGDSLSGIYAKCVKGDVWR